VPELWQLTCFSCCDGQVSRLQVAELIASIVANPEVAENKVGA
jgi:hypothetical protein